MFSGNRGLVLFLGGAVAIIALAITFGFQNQKSDARTVRSFLDLAAAGQAAEAHALLHPGTRQSMSANALADAFGQLQPFERVRLNNWSWSTSAGLREMTIQGSGETVAGCVSRLEFELLNGEITRFHIFPPCLREGVES